MSTTTSYSYCTVKSQSGSGSSWDTGSIITSTTANAEIVPAPAGKFHKTLEISVPSWAADIDAGSEFVSMDIKTKAYNYATETGGGSSFFNMLIKQGGTTTKTIAKNGTSSVEATHSGDKTYWGFTGTVQQIISDIKSGNIKIQFAGSVASTTPYQERHIDTFHIRVTYRAPDTKRAHLIAMIP